MRIKLALEGPRFIMEDILINKKSLFMFAKNEESKLIEHFLLSMPKKHEVLWIKGEAEAILHKNRNSNTFEDITEKEDKIDEVYKKSIVDYFILDNLGKKDFFPMLKSIYEENEAIIAVFRDTTLEEFIQYLNGEVESDVLENHPHLSRYYYLYKTLPFVIEGDDVVSSFKELRLSSEGTVKGEDLYVEENGEWNWTGYYPSFYRSGKEDIEEVMQEIYFKGDKYLERAIKGDLADKLLEVAEVYYTPNTRRIDTGLGSHFGGSPLLKEGESHPVCESCGEPLALLLQLDFKNSPKKIRELFGLEEGYLQVMHCAESEFCEVDEDLQNIRYIEGTNLKVSDIDQETIPRKEITGWSMWFEKPSKELIEKHNIGLTSLEEEYLKWFYDEKYKQTTDKIGGKPNYIQADPELKSKSGDPMKFIIQIVSYNNLDYFIGNGGHLYVYQSPTDKTEFRYHWDCD